MRPSDVPLMPLVGAGRALETGDRTRLELLTGQSLASVRVHSEPDGARAARALHARAFSFGEHLVFGAGEYRPGTLDGARLLAHEVAHALHARSAPTLRPGIAPADSEAERRAESLAATPSDGRSALPDFASWGPAWQLNRQSITNAGKPESLGGIYDDPSSGVPRDFVSSESGAEADTGPWGHLANAFAIDVRGADAPQTQFLQFYWIELTATMPTGYLQLEGTVPTTSSRIGIELSKRSAPVWDVDSQAATPFYESSYPVIRTGGGNAPATPVATLVDVPGEGGEDVVKDFLRVRDPGTPHTLTLHLDTYLIVGGRPAYHVAWTSATTYTRNAGNYVFSGARHYHVDAAGPVTVLPDQLRHTLGRRYPAFANLGKPPERHRRRPPHIQTFRWPH
jgi:uncharacterized protein DUF4157